MKAPKTGQGLTDRLRALARESASDEPPQKLGRHLLIARPLFPDSEPAGNEECTAKAQSDWIDSQLYDCLPRQSELDSLDDARRSALEEAWPDGYDGFVHEGECYSHAGVTVWWLVLRICLTPIFQSITEQQEAASALARKPDPATTSSE
jgi:hypothetical protein